MTKRSLFTTLTVLLFVALAGRWFLTDRRSASTEVTAVTVAPVTEQTIQAELQRLPAPRLEDVAKELKREGQKELETLFLRYRNELQAYTAADRRAGAAQADYTKLFVAHAGDPGHPEVAQAHEKLEGALKDMQERVEVLGKVSGELNRKYVRYALKKFGLAERTE